MILNLDKLFGLTINVQRCLRKAKDADFESEIIALSKTMHSLGIPLVFTPSYNDKAACNMTTSILSLIFLTPNTAA